MVLAAWVMLGNQVFQALIGNMGVDLGGVDVGMAEQHLHHAQVSAVIDQMGGKRMAQFVWADVLNADLLSIFVNDHPGQLSCHTHALLADKHEITRFLLQQRWPSMQQVLGHPFTGFFTQRNQALFVAFAYGGDHALLQIHITQLQTHGFGNPHARGVHQFEQCFVA